MLYMNAGNTDTVFLWNVKKIVLIQDNDTSGAVYISAISDFSHDDNAETIITTPTHEPNGTHYSQYNNNNNKYFIHCNIINEHLQM